MTVTGIEKLRSDHDTNTFDCGKPELDTFLQRFALVNQRYNLAQTYVLCRDRSVIAYWSLAVGQVRHADPPPRITAGSGRYTAPLMILARLAVMRNEQRRGWGAQHYLRTHYEVPHRQLRLVAFEPCSSTPGTKKRVLF